MMSYLFLFVFERQLETVEGESLGLEGRLVVHGGFGGRGLPVEHRDHLLARAALVQQFARVVLTLRAQFHVCVFELVLHLGEALQLPGQLPKNRETVGNFK